jgi:hypothetical protein
MEFVQRMTSCRIRQIYFRDDQIGFLDDLWEPYLNKTVTPYFENEVFRKLFLAGDYNQSDYYGVFSYKFSNKHHKDGHAIESYIQADEYAHDVYSFFGNNQFKTSTKKNTFFDPHHPHLLEIGRELIKKLFGKEIHTIKADRIYYNHWIAKSDIFAGYCKDMLIPAMDLMESDKYIKELCNMDAKYNNTSLSKHIQAFQMMSTERCMEVFGVPYYTHHAFILERLPSIYFALKNHSIKHI